MMDFLAVHIGKFSVYSMLLPDASRRQQRAADAIRRSLGAKRLTTSEFT